MLLECRERLALLETALRGLGETLNKRYQIISAFCEVWLAVLVTFFLYAVLGLFLLYAVFGY